MVFMLSLFLCYFGFVLVWCALARRALERAFDLARVALRACRSTVPLQKLHSPLVWELLVDEKDAGGSLVPWLFWGKCCRC